MNELIEEGSQKGEETSGPGVPAFCIVYGPCRFLRNHIFRIVIDQTVLFFEKSFRHPDDFFKVDYITLKNQTQKTQVENDCLKDFSRLLIYMMK